MILKPTLFARLPDDIIYKICVYTGKFILRYDNKVNKAILVSIIDMNDKLWISFNKMMLGCFVKKQIKQLNDAQNSDTCSMSRNGDLCIKIRLQPSSPPPVSLMDYMNGQPNVSKKYKKRR